MVSEKKAYFRKSTRRGKEVPRGGGGWFDTCVCGGGGVLRKKGINFRNLY